MPKQGNDALFAHGRERIDSHHREEALKWHFQFNGHRVPHQDYDTCLGSLDCYDIKLFFYVFMIYV